MLRRRLIGSPRNALFDVDVLMDVARARDDVEDEEVDSGGWRSSVVWDGRVCSFFVLGVVVVVVVL